MSFDSLNGHGYRMVTAPSEGEMAALRAQLDADRAEILASAVKAFRDKMAPHYQAYDSAMARAAAA